MYNGHWFRPQWSFYITYPCDLLMSLPIRYSPMAFYFWLSIIFLTPQILRHQPCWHSLLQPLCKGLHDHHQLYPIPIAPSAQCHVRDLPYDLWTTLLYFPLLVSFLLPNTFCRGLTDHRSSHRTVRTLPYVSPHNKPCARFTYCLYLRPLYLLRKTRKFSWELRLKFILSHHFASLHLCTFALSHTSDTLRFIAPYQTSISHHFALLDTMSGDHFTAPKSHPSEPHRIYT